ncbi:MAG: hypothetical protein K2I84_01555 [Bacteroidales bacterium]|nr:hypothetical protein [Bacteroidales bacterium]
METKILNPIDAVKTEIERLFDDAVAGLFVGKPIPIGKLTDAGRAYLQHLSGEQMKPDVDFVLNPSDLVHIYNRHFGDKEQDKRNIPLTKDDIRNIVDVAAKPDKILFQKEEKLQRKTFIFLKSTAFGTYNLLEVYADKRGNLTAKTFYKTKKGVSQRVMHFSTLHFTSETDGATLNVGTNIPQILEFQNLPKG